MIVDDVQSALRDALPDLNAACSLAASEECFRMGLYLEHVEEASFLYEQRRDSLRDDPELAWTDLADAEERLEAHLDALVLGGELALAVCRQQAEEGDAGEFYAALCVFCRQQRKDLLEEALGGVEAEDEERVLAVRDALAAELPEAWEQDLVGDLGHDDAWRQRVAAYVAGYRRLPVSEDLARALPDVGAEVMPAVLWALGRTRTEAAAANVWGYLRHERTAVREAAALALLRLGRPAAVKHVAANVAAPWAMRLLGISGGAEHRAPLQAQLAAGSPSADGLLALGLLGAPESVDDLLAALRDPALDPALAEAGALGLHILTGAALYEDVFVPEAMDEDELFEDELDAFRRGEPPTRPDGERYGTTVTRLSQDPEVWETWWDEHRTRFQPGLRYRLGEPCTPLSLVRALASERMPRSVRQLMHEELIIRYNAEATAEADTSVVEQQRGIDELERRIAQEGLTFQPGCWYFAGRPLPG